ncbi:MAG TPA: hypothetical protein VN721_07080 [Flavipsychrobacter sp.]|nr:hypothetical protein [Flavipsychrobacter sp.]
MPGLSGILKMFRNILICCLFFSYTLYGQNDSVIKYVNGNPKYIQTYEDGVLKKNIYLLSTGDTVYKWDINKCLFTDYPVTGIYLLEDEYKAYNKQLLRTRGDLVQQKATMGNVPLNTSPTTREWRSAHDIFFKKCADYTKVIHEGDFTFVTAYKNGIQSGEFKKFYLGKPVVYGSYKKGHTHGIWIYHPYKFYPYTDVVIMNLYGRDWSVMYSIIPAIFLILLLLIIGKYTFRVDKYNAYFYTVAGLAFITLWLRLDYNHRPQNAWIRETIPTTWFVIWHAMMLLSIINLFLLGKRTNAFIVVNIILLLVGLILSMYILFFRHMQFA